jgi:hypothetical protein
MRMVTMCEVLLRVPPYRTHPVLAHLRAARSSRGARLVVRAEEAAAVAPKKVEVGPKRGSKVRTWRSHGDSRRPGALGGFLDIP